MCPTGQLWPTLHNSTLTEWSQSNLVLQLLEQVHQNRYIDSTKRLFNSSTSPPTIRLINIPSTSLYQQIMANFVSRQASSGGYQISFQSQNAFANNKLFLHPHLRHTVTAHRSITMNPLARTELGGDMLTINDLRCNRMNDVFTIKGTVTQIRQKQMMDHKKSFQCYKCQGEQEVTADLTHQDAFYALTRCGLQVSQTQPSNGNSSADRDRRRDYATPSRGRGGYTTNRAHWNNNSGNPRQNLPTLCEGNRFQPLPQTAILRDAQVFSLTESSSIGASGIPISLTALLLDDLCGTLAVGDDVVIAGQLTYYWRKFSQNQRMDMDMRFVANNISVTRTSSSSHAVSASSQSTMMMNQLNRFYATAYTNNQKISSLMHYDLTTTRIVYTILRTYGQWPLLFRSLLVHSVAPTLVGMHIHKLAILLSLIGGVDVYNKESKTKARGSSHLLLIGPPGCGKSHLSRSAASIAPRSILTTGSGTSSAGLTVAAATDSDGHWTLEAGALVLASGGICCIDEFSTMKQTDKSAIHEAMEQQTVSVAKGGMTTTIHTKTTIIAAQNPRKGNAQVQAAMLRKNDRSAATDFFSLYAPGQLGDSTLSEYTGISPPLLSRFDMILVSGEPTLDQDRLVATTIMKTRFPIPNQLLIDATKKIFFNRYLHDQHPELEQYTAPGQPLPPNIQDFSLTSPHQLHYDYPLLIPPPHLDRLSVLLSPELAINTYIKFTSPTDPLSLSSPSTPSTVISSSTALTFSPQAQTDSPHSIYNNPHHHQQQHPSRLIDNEYYSTYRNQHTLKLPPGVSVMTYLTKGYPVSVHKWLAHAHYSAKSMPGSTSADITNGDGDEDEFEFDEQKVQVTSDPVQVHPKTIQVTSLCPPQLISRDGKKKNKNRSILQNGAKNQHNLVPVETTSSPTTTVIIPEHSIARLEPNQILLYNDLYNIYDCISQYLKFDTILWYDINLSSGEFTFTTHGIPVIQDCNKVELPSASLPLLQPVGHDMWWANPLYDRYYHSIIQSSLPDFIIPENPESDERSEQSPESTNPTPKKQPISFQTHLQQEQQKKLSQSQNSLELSSPLITLSDILEQRVHMPLPTVKRYLHFISAKKPRLPHTIRTLLRGYYLLRRAFVSQRQGMINNDGLCSVRLLDSLVRLTHAHAKLLCRDECLIVDAITAISIIHFGHASIELFTGSPTIPDVLSYEDTIMKVTNSDPDARADLFQQHHGRDDQYDLDYDNNIVLGDEVMMDQKLIEKYNQQNDPLNTVLFPPSPPPQSHSVPQSKNPKAKKGGKRSVKKKDSSDEFSNNNSNNAMTDMIPQRVSSKQGGKVIKGHIMGNTGAIFDELDREEEEAAANRHRTSTLHSTSNEHGYGTAMQTPVRKSSGRSRAKQIQASPATTIRYEGDDVGSASEDYFDDGDQGADNYGLDFEDFESVVPPNVASRQAAPIQHNSSVKSNASLISFHSLHNPAVRVDDLLSQSSDDNDDDHFAFHSHVSTRKHPLPPPPPPPSNRGFSTAKNYGNPSNAQHQHSQNYQQYTQNDYLQSPSQHQQSQTLQSQSSQRISPTAAAAAPSPRYSTPNQAQQFVAPTISLNSILHRQNTGRLNKSQQQSQSQSQYQDPFQRNMTGFDTFSPAPMYNQNNNNYNNNNYNNANNNANNNYNQNQNPNHLTDPYQRNTITAARSPPSETTIVDYMRNHEQQSHPASDPSSTPGSSGRSVKHVLSNLLGAGYSPHYNHPQELSKLYPPLLNPQLNSKYSAYIFQIYKQQYAPAGMKDGEIYIPDLFKAQLPLNQSTTPIDQTPSQTQLIKETTLFSSTYLTTLEMLFVLKFVVDDHIASISRISRGSRSVFDKFDDFHQDTVEMMGDMPNTHSYGQMCKFYSQFLILDELLDMNSDSSTTPSHKQPHRTKAVFELSQQPLFYPLPSDPLAQTQLKFLTDVLTRLELMIDKAIATDCDLNELTFKRNRLNQQQHQHQHQQLQQQQSTGTGGQMNIYHRTLTQMQHSYAEVDQSTRLDDIQSSMIVLIDLLLPCALSYNLIDYTVIKRAIHEAPVRLCEFYKAKRVETYSQNGATIQENLLQRQFLDSRLASIQEANIRARSVGIYEDIQYVSPEALFQSNNPSSPQGKKFSKKSNIKSPNNNSTINNTTNSARDSSLSTSSLSSSLRDQLASLVSDINKPFTAQFNYYSLYNQHRTSKSKHFSHPKPTFPEAYTRPDIITHAWIPILSAIKMVDLSTFAESQVTTMLSDLSSSLPPTPITQSSPLQRILAMPDLSYALFEPLLVRILNGEALSLEESHLYVHSYRSDRELPRSTFNIPTHLRCEKERQEAINDCLANGIDIESTRPDLLQDAVLFGELTPPPQGRFNGGIALESINPHHPQFGMTQLDQTLNDLEVVIDLQLQVDGAYQSGSGWNGNNAGNGKKGFENERLRARIAESTRIQQQERELQHQFHTQTPQRNKQGQTTDLLPQPHAIASVPKATSMPQPVPTDRTDLSSQFDTNHNTSRSSTTSTMVSRSGRPVRLKSQYNSMITPIVHKNPTFERFVEHKVDHLIQHASKSDMRSRFGCMSSQETSDAESLMSSYVGGDDDDGDEIQGTSHDAKYYQNNANNLKNIHNNHIDSTKHSRRIIQDDSTPSNTPKQSQQSEQKQFMPLYSIHQNYAVLSMPKQQQQQQHQQPPPTSQQKHKSSSLFKSKKPPTQQSTESARTNSHPTTNQSTPVNNTTAQPQQDNHFASPVARSLHRESIPIPYEIHHDDDDWFSSQPNTPHQHHTSSSVEQTPGAQHNSSTKTRCQPGSVVKKPVTKPLFAKSPAPVQSSTQTTHLPPNPQTTTSQHSTTTTSSSSSSSSTAKNFFESSDDDA